MPANNEERKRKHTRQLYAQRASNAMREYPDTKLNATARTGSLSRLMIFPSVGRISIVATNTNDPPVIAIKIPVVTRLPSAAEMVHPIPIPMMARMINVPTER
jgi:hypothetical protein